MERELRPGCGSVADLMARAPTSAEAELIQYDLTGRYDPLPRKSRWRGQGS